MAAEFEFFGPGDKPALVAFNNPHYLAQAKAGLEAAGCKVRAASGFEQFMDLFTRASYQVVVIEDVFGGSPENATLAWVQGLPMNQRRHAVFILVGEKWESLDPLLAFQQSVHAVLNYNALDQFAQLVEKCVGDNTSFLLPFRIAQDRILKAG